jgi:hypothetical protein
LDGARHVFPVIVSYEMQPFLRLNERFNVIDVDPTVDVGEFVTEAHATARQRL